MIRKFFARDLHYVVPQKNFICVWGLVLSKILEILPENNANPFCAVSTYIIYLKGERIYQNYF